jgi:Ni,Fe-hydrogenase maturation factor
MVSAESSLLVTNSRLQTYNLLMNKKSLDEIRTELRKKSPILAGEDGETFAERWFQQNSWVYCKIEQGKTSLSTELCAYGGKRPDFIIETENDDHIIVVDAKYHSTEGCRVFKLTDEEIEKYSKLKQFIENKFRDKFAEVLFMVIPKEHSGRKLVWVGLPEFENGIVSKLGGKSATQISLENRASLWSEIEP